MSLSLRYRRGKFQGFREMHAWTWTQATSVGGERSHQRDSLAPKKEDIVSIIQKITLTYIKSDLW